MTSNKHPLSRLENIHAWLKVVLPKADYQLKPASSDASFRRYFRISQQGRSWILMDAPPAYEDTAPFIKIAKFLFSHEINAPEIIAEDTKAGFLLISDLGKTQYLQVLEQSTASRLYQSAIDELIQMQLCKIDDLKLPDYDGPLLNQEMSLFPEWFLKKHLQIDPPKFLNEVYEFLAESASQQPTAFVHRDYHSRNLMYIEDNKPGIIDFQDAVCGPISYDLVSLLRDCYIDWPDDQLLVWIDYYFSKAQSHGIIDPSTTQEKFIRWFDLMGLQRHLKVLGIFSRLNYRDNKPAYMLDIPLTLKYVRKISGRYTELASFHQFISDIPEVGVS